MIKVQKYEADAQKVKALIYGSSGAGKTRFSATAPKPFYVNAERGLMSARNVLKARGEDLEGYSINTLKDLQDAYKYLSEFDHPYETVVIDSISEINEIIKPELEAKRPGGMVQKDWGDLHKKIKSILRKFRDLDMHVIFIAQESVEKDEQVIHKIVPLLNGKSATEIAYYMDIVGYPKIIEGTRRIITDTHNKLLTKDRSDILLS